MTTPDNMRTTKNFENLYLITDRNLVYTEVKILIRMLVISGFLEVDAENTRIFSKVNPIRRVIANPYIKAKCQISLKTYNPFMKRKLNNSSNGGLIPFNKNRPIREISENAITNLFLL